MGKAIVLVPMTRSEKPKLTGMPDTVIPEPGKRVVSATENPVGFGVMIWPATVKIDFLA